RRLLGEEFVDSLDSQRADLAVEAPMLPRQARVADSHGVSPHQFVDHRGHWKCAASRPWSRRQEFRSMEVVQTHLGLAAFGAVLPQAQYATGGPRQGRLCLPLAQA